MVYALAAYSITLGALLVYGILLQHRLRRARARAGGVSWAELGRGFNLGAALLAPFWALAHGQRAAGAMLLASGIACVAARVGGLRLPALLLGSLLLGGAVFFGVVGNRVAAGTMAAGDVVVTQEVAGRAVEDFARTQLGWSLAGALLFSVVLPWAGYFWGAGGAG